MRTNTVKSNAMRMPASIIKAAVLVLIVHLEINCHETEMSESAIRAMVEEDESRGIYRLENKNEIKQFSNVLFEELKIFCHHGMF